MKLSIRIVLFSVILLASMAFAQVRHDETAETKTVLLWESGAPGAQGQTDDDKPSLTIFRTFETKTPGTAVIVVPGGSYGFLASNHEGRQVANWFNSMGVTSFVLRYRLGPRYHHPIELGDAQRAIRWVGVTPRSLGFHPIGSASWDFLPVATLLRPQRLTSTTEIPPLVIQLIA